MNETRLSGCYIRVEVPEDESHRPCAPGIPVRQRQANAGWLLVSSSQLEYLLTIVYLVLDIYRVCGELMHYK
jgi:hypothetical protein